MTSVVFQGCLVFAMVLPGQLQIKHITRLHEINTALQTAVSTDNICSLQTEELGLQSGSITNDSHPLWLGKAPGTLGMNSSQTPFSRSGGVSVSYRTSSLSHLKTVSFLVFATCRTEIANVVCGALGSTVFQILNHRPKTEKGISFYYRCLRQRLYKSYHS